MAFSIPDLPSNFLTELLRIKGNSPAEVAANLKRYHPDLEIILLDSQKKYGEKDPEYKYLQQFSESSGAYFAPGIELEHGELKNGVIVAYQNDLFTSLNEPHGTFQKRCCESKRTLES